MKNRFLVALFVMITPFIAFAQGVNFEQLSFDQAVAKAKKENKLVMLDCYTSWCGPCKMMSNEVFVLKEAGDYFNKRFVNIKIDMEKGEGPELAKRLGVKAYPTFVLANGKGEIVGKFAGGYRLESFTKKIEEVQKTPYDEAKKRFEKGKMNTAEKIAYMNLLSSASERDAAKEIAESLLANASDKEKQSKLFWQIFENNRLVYLTTEHFKYIVKNKAAFDKIVGKEAVDKKLYSCYFSSMIGSIYGNIGGGGAVMPIDEIVGYQKEAMSLNIEGSDMLDAQFNIAIGRYYNDAKRMAVNIEKLFPHIDKGNHWSYASAFLKVFESNPEAVNIAEVKAIGKKFVDSAEEKSKMHYMSLFKVQ